MVDRVQRKKRLIGAGFTTIGKPTGTRPAPSSSRGKTSRSKPFVVPRAPCSSQRQKESDAWSAGLAMLSVGPWVLPLPLATRHLILVPYLIAEGVLSPLIMPAMLPDML